MKIYGSYSDADLDHWQNLPMNSYVLTQSAFGAWLMRRDENKAKQFPAIPLDKVKQERERQHSKGTQALYNEKYLYAVKVLDKLIEESEGKE